MKHLNKLFILLVVSLFNASVMAAAYLKYDGYSADTEGEATQGGHQTHEAYEFGHEVHQPGTGAEQGMSTGRRHHQEIQINKMIDKASPKLTPRGHRPQAGNDPNMP